MVYRRKRKKARKTMATAANNNVHVNVDAVDTTERDQRKHLERRLSDVLYAKKAALRDKFYINDDPSPTTFKELLERIQQGRYIYLKELEEQDTKSGLVYLPHPFNYVRWRTKEADNEGYKKAVAQLMEKYDEALDIIRIMPPQQGLEQLNKFKNLEV